MPYVYAKFDVYLLVNSPVCVNAMKATEVAETCRLDVFVVNNYIKFYTIKTLQI